MTTRLHEWKAIDADRYYWDLYEDGVFVRPVYAYWGDTKKVYSWENKPGEYIAKRPHLSAARASVQEQYPGIEIVSGDA